MVSTGLTVCYTFRLIFYRIVGNFNLMTLVSVDDRNRIITRPMVGLALGAVIGGSFLSWLIFPSPSMICLTLEVKCLALIVRAVGGLIGYILNIIRVSFSLISLVVHPLVRFSGSM